MTKRSLPEAGEHTFVEGWEVREVVETRLENTDPNWEVFAWRSWIERV